MLEIRNLSFEVEGKKILNDISLQFTENAFTQAPSFWMERTSRRAAWMSVPGWASATHFSSRPALRG